MTQAPGRPIVQSSLTLPPLLERLVEEGLIGREHAQAMAPDDPRHPLVAVANLGVPDRRNPDRTLSLEALVQWLAARTQMPYYRIDPLTIDVARVTTVMPYAYAARLKILPVKVTAEDVTIATSDPYQRKWLDEVQRALKLPIRLVLSNPVDIERYIVEFYTLSRSVKASQEDRRATSFGAARNLEQLMELGRAGKLDANDQHVVNIVDWLLQYAFESRASDVHLEPRREKGNIRFRIDGVLHEVYQVPLPVMIAITSRIKILSRLDVAEKRKPQDGRVKTRTPKGREVELRVASLPTAFGEKLVMRIFDPDVLVKDFHALGFAEADAARWQKMIHQPHGILLVTGPTGAGKTTTLYSSLKQLATSAVNVCTIEDPIELVEPAFNQMQVQPAIDLGFADGIRALMRQDPDIIMVGEIRDLATAETAIQAALTGHLVLSTLHTNDAPSAVVRLMEIGVPAYLLRATLLGVIAQRLLRTLCRHCRQPTTIDSGTWAELTSGWPVARPETAYAPGRCLECRETGFVGRVGIYEVMPISAGMQSLIREPFDIDPLRAEAIREHMTPLRIGACQKVASGITTLEEALGVTPAPQHLAR